jgi:hypothetical protein
LQADGGPAAAAATSAPGLDASTWFDSNLPPAHEQPEAVNLRASDDDPATREAHEGLASDDGPLSPLPVFDTTGEIPRVPSDATEAPQAPQRQPYSPPRQQPPPPPPPSAPPDTPPL